MYSVVEIAGKQYSVKVGDIIAVDKLANEKDENVEFSKVLLLRDETDNLIIGRPYVDNVKVEAKVISQDRDKKVLVFKYKKRKNYKKLRGHKQHYTTIKIEKITKV